MKVLYDHQIFTDQKFGGVSRYFYELLNSYQNDEEISATISLALSNNHYIQQYSFSSHYNLLPNINFRGKGRIFKAINTFNTINKLRTLEYEIFHPTYYDPYFLKYIGNKPFVLTVYDMIHEKYKEMFAVHNQSDLHRTIQNKKLLVQKASHIIAISNSTKQDIIDIYNINESDISVIHLGNSILQGNGLNQIPENIPEHFILYVGGRLLHKNFDKFIRAAAKVLQTNKELTVVCVGGDKFSQYELGLFSKLGIYKQIKQFDLDDLTLNIFYRKALFFVFPSLYEGFGIPILEAFACNCPLLCSNTSSFPEIAGDAACYFDPNSIDSIYNAIQHALDDRYLLSELKIKGCLRLNDFSLKKTALKTKEIYCKLL